MIGLSGALVTFILQQTPIIAFMGLVLWFVYKETSASLKRKDAIILKKDDQLTALSEKALKVASLWDAKSDLNSREHDNIIDLIDEIRDDVKEMKTLNSNKK